MLLLGEEAARGCLLASVSNRCPAPTLCHLVTSHTSWQLTDHHASTTTIHITTFDAHLCDADGIVVAFLG